MKCQLSLLETASPSQTHGQSRSSPLSPSLPTCKRQCISRFDCRREPKPELRTPESRQHEQQQPRPAKPHHPPQHDDQDPIWSARARSIRDWALDVARSSHGDMSDLRSESSRRRAHKTSVRSRSASPTKKSPEYRQNAMARAHVYVDHIFDLPANVDAMRRSVLGNALDGAIELDAISATHKEHICAIASDYMNCCRELARDAKGEAEWRSELLTGPFQRLVRLLGQGTLATSASDKLWRPELKPRPPTLRDLLSIATPRLSPAAATAPPPPAAFNLTYPPTPTDPTDTVTVASETTASDLDPDPSNPLTTPKPDITVGLARSSFTELLQVLLGEWQDTRRMLSDPHLVQSGLHFPFLLVETKGLTTSGNMMGAENQAAVGGACAMNIMHALQRLDPDAASSPLGVVFSIATEGPMHNLFMHYRIDGKFHMTVLRAWRVTLQSNCEEFVYALARILLWGVGEFREAVIDSLERVVQKLRG